MDAVKRYGGLNMNSNQYQQILAHFKQGKTISQAESIELFNCYRLSAVIYRLRNAGHEIITLFEPNSTSHGTHARYEYKEVKK